MYEWSSIKEDAAKNSLETSIIFSGFRKIAKSDY